MLEALIYYFGAKILGAMVEGKGYSAWPIRVMFIVCGMGAEAGGFVVGQARTDDKLVWIGFAYGGVACVAVVFFLIAAILPNLNRTGRSYSDYSDHDGEPEDIEKFREARRRAANQKRELRERREREERRRRMPIKALPELPDEPEDDRPRGRARDDDDARPRRRSKE
jgi:hypothetical protein